MKKINICFLIIFIPCLLFSNNIIGYEYWYDSDYSNVTTINLSTPTDFLNLSLDLNIEHLSYGLHKFNIRFEDSLNNWSIVQTKFFFNYLTPDSAEIHTDNKIVEYQYWFDNDTNKLTSVNLSEPVNNYNLSLNLNLENLSYGFHKFYIRYKDSMNNWSAIQIKCFFNFKESTQKQYCDNKLSSYRYWFDSDTTTIENIILQEKIDAVNEILNISQIPYLGDHILNLQLQDSIGNWSGVIPHNFEGVFNHIVVGNTVSFNIIPQPGYSYRWLFGDGTTDTIPCPLHTYELGGLWDVKLIFSKDGFIDTVQNSIAVLGVQKLVPCKGGNTGDVSVYIYGHGFNEFNRVSLLEENNEVIYPDTTILINTNTLVARFNLRNKSIGISDFVIEYPGDTTIIIDDWFTIEEGVDPKLNIEFIGNDAYRISQPFTQFSIVYSNSGNIDAFAVPFDLVLVGDYNSDLFITNIKSYNSDTIQVINDLPDIVRIDTLFNYPESAEILSIIIPLIPPGSSRKLDFKINSPFNNYSLYYRIGEPFYHSPLSSQKIDCILDAIACAVPFIPIPGVDCVYGYYDLMFRIIRDACYHDDKIVSHVASNAIEATLTCLSYAFPPVALANRYSQIEKCLMYLPLECALAFQPKPKHIEMLFGKDPNEIYGPLCNHANNYINSNRIMPYKIAFENIDSATAAAQEVIINDPLDKTKFDFSTFQLGSISFGDTTFNLPPGLSEYTFDVDLRTKCGLILRIDATLDTATGMASWHFISLDTLTNSKTEDPYAGFLPPNVTPPEGDGYVTYSIKPLQTLSNGTIIKNKASIIFDYNEAIETNEWSNTIDNDKPVSSVQSLDGIGFSTTFTVNWSGSDITSAPEFYDIYVAINNGPYNLWLYHSENTSATFTGAYDSTYSFYSIAIDYAGNVENLKTISEAQTTLIKLQPPTLVSPPNHQQSVDLYVNFDWSDATFAEKYYIQVSDNSDFSNLIIDSNSVRISNYLIINQSLLRDNSYYWRVKSIAGDAESEWSDTLSFTTCQATIHNTSKGSYYCNLEDAIDDAISGNEIVISGYTHNGNIDITGLGLLLKIGEQDFILNGQLTGGLIQAVGTGYLSKTMPQNEAQTFPLTDGTNNYTVTATYLNLPSQPLKIKINDSKNLSDAIMSDMIDIKGEENMNATLKFWIPKSVLTSSWYNSNNVMRYYNGSRYVAIPQDQVTIVDKGSFYEITITGINQF